LPIDAPFVEFNNEIIWSNWNWSKIGTCN
jgi:hypothetical protein